MNSQQIVQLIRTGLPDSEAIVKSDDNVHFEAVVVSAAFAGKRPVQRHQLVYGALGDKMGNEIHALALQVYTPEEAAKLKA
jgi:acid stress-induced BolA-like protein IbaG/YrbA